RRRLTVCRGEPRPEDLDPGAAPHRGGDRVAVGRRRGGEGRDGPGPRAVAVAGGERPGAEGARWGPAGPGQAAGRRLMRDVEKARLPERPDQPAAGRLAREPLGRAGAEDGRLGAAEAVVVAGDGDVEQVRRAERGEQAPAAGAEHEPLR